MFAMSLSFNSIDYIEHPDIKIIESENLNTLGVDDIRDVINKDNLSPIEGKYKVVIFPPVKSLTEEASNALLKTIEEPSSSSIFLILSSGKFWSHARDDSENMILSTIKSRCRTIFLETENEIKYDFSSSDFENFLNGNYYDLKLKKADFDKLLDSVKSLEQINSTDSKRIKDTQILINTTNDFISSLDENTALNSTSLLIESLSYLASTLLIQEGLNKNYYEFASKIENSMQEISAGMRPQIVLSNLMLTTGTHG
jgi:DNA polymerase III delta prime subunit